QAVRNMEPLCPEKAAVLGACKVLPQEYPNIKCQNIDLDLNGPAETDLLAANLERELTSVFCEPMVAWRKGRRWVPTFESVKLPKPADGAIPLRRGGVVLITGGLGKIGLVLSETLASAAHAKLILTGRSAFPTRGEWNQWLLQNPSGATSDKIRRLQEIEAL